MSQPRSASVGPGWEWRVAGTDEALLAYPLITAVEGVAVDLTQWRRRLRSWLGSTAESRGIMALHGQLSSILALFFFAIEQPARGLRRLHVPRLWLVEIGASGHLSRVTLAGIEAAARDAGCAEVGLARGHAGVRSLGGALGLEQLGYVLAAGGRRWLRRLDDEDDG